MGSLGMLLELREVQPDVMPPLHRVQSWRSAFEHADRSTTSEREFSNAAFDLLLR